MKTKIMILTILTILPIAIGCNEQKINVMQNNIDKYISEKYNGWHILELKDLYKDDIQLWKQNRNNNEYPGVAKGKFDDTNKDLIAILIIRKIDDQKQVKLLLFKDENKPAIELYETNVGNYPVIYTLPSGQYSDFYDTTKIYNVKHECIAFEIIEASVKLFYFEGGHYRIITYSD